MKDRCKNPKHQAYKYYGGKGIKVCKRWEKYENFVEDMGFPPTPKHTLDRIDANKNYCKKNCRWVTRREQIVNVKKNNVFDGDTTVERSIKLGGNKSMVYLRIRAGMSIEDAFTLPKGCNKRKYKRDLLG